MQIKSQRRYNLMLVEIGKPTNRGVSKAAGTQGSSCPADGSAHWVSHSEEQPAPISQIKCMHT